MMSIYRLITHLGETTWASTRANKEATVPTTSGRGGHCGNTGDIDNGPDPDGGVEVMASPAPLQPPLYSRECGTQRGRGAVVS